MRSNKYVFDAIDFYEMGKLFASKLRTYVQMYWQSIFDLKASENVRQREWSNAHFRVRGATAGGFLA